MSVERPQEIVLDVSGVSDEETLHEYLSKTLDFPGYYGMNWDAFYDCIMYDPELRMPRLLKIKGFGELSRILPDSADKFAKCLADYAKEYPEQLVRYENEK